MVNLTKAVKQLKTTTALIMIIAIVSIITLIVVSTKKCKCDCGNQENFRWWWQPREIRPLPRATIISSDDSVLRRSRPGWRDSSYSVERIIDDAEYDWSEGVRGLTYYKKQSDYVTSGKDGDRFIVVKTNSSDGFVELEEDFPMYRECVKRGMYGQGSFYQDDRMLVPIICGNRTLLNIRSGSRLGTRLHVTIPNVKARWVAYDSITGMMFIPHDQSNGKLLKIGIYQFTDMVFNSTIRHVRDLTLTHFLNDCTAGVFSEDGILWLLENGRDKGECWGFHLSVDGVGNVIGRRKKIASITRPIEGVLDAQDFVGLARKDGKLITLLRNQDVGTDNLSLYRINGLM